HVSPPRRVPTAIGRFDAQSRTVGKRLSNGARRRLAQQRLQLGRGADVALDLDLPGHHGGRRVLLAGHELAEDLLPLAEAHVRPAVALGAVDLPVVDRDEPRARVLDLEEVRVRDPGGLLRRDALGQGLEELADALHLREPTDYASIRPSKLAAAPGLV